MPVTSHGSFHRKTARWRKTDPAPAPTADLCIRIYRPISSLLGDIHGVRRFLPAPVRGRPNSRRPHPGHHRPMPTGRRAGIRRRLAGGIALQSTVLGDVGPDDDRSGSRSNHQAHPHRQCRQSAATSSTGAAGRGGRDARRSVQRTGHLWCRPRFHANPFPGLRHRPGRRKGPVLGGLGCGAGVMGARRFHL